MTCRGVVRNGKVELDAGASFPEGAAVWVDVIRNESREIDQASSTAEWQVEAMTHEQWLTELDRLSQDISRAWQSPKSALEILAESRR